MKNTAHTLAAIVGIAGVVGGLSGNALADTGGGALDPGPGGDHLYIDGSTPGFPFSEMELWAYQAVVDGVSFDAGWSDSVLPAWRGVVSVTGFSSLSASGTPFGGSAGTTNLDFSGMPGDELAMGTYFNFGDLDGGSGSNEWFTFRAWDDSGDVIEEAWLSEIVGVRYVNGSPPPMNDMPSWSFVDGVYRFAGNHTGANPNDLFSLTTLASISSLEIVRGSPFNGFSMGAPIPTPGAVSLLAVGGLMASRRRR